MQAVTRAQAKADGLQRYFTGAPCKRGHLAERQTSNGTCFECARLCNPEKKRANGLARYHANKDAARARYRAYYLRRREYMLERARRYREQNPEKVVFNNCRRRAIRKGAEGDYTRADIDQIRVKQRCRCAICDGRLTRKNESIDHILPLSKGGTNWPRNLQLVCRSCNSRKHDKDPVEFMRELGRLI